MICARVATSAGVECRVSRDTTPATWHRSQGKVIRPGASLSSSSGIASGQRRHVAFQVNNDLAGALTAFLLTDEGLDEQNPDLQGDPYPPRNCQLLREGG